jgi:hypothetical protein
MSEANRKYADGFCQTNLSDGRVVQWAIPMRMSAGDLSVLEKLMELTFEIRREQVVKHANELWECVATSG